MGAHEILLQFIAQTVNDLVYANTGGVGGNDSIGLAERLNLLENALLDGDVFGSGLDDPVSFTDIFQIVSGVADSDVLDSSLGIKHVVSGVLDVGHAVESKTIAELKALFCETLGLFFIGQALGRNDVQHCDLNADACEQTGY